MSMRFLSFNKLPPFPWVFRYILAHSAAGRNWNFHRLPPFQVCAILDMVISMNNIPVFLSRGGTATLILREVPYSQKAYILLRTVAPEGLPILVRECVDFCRTCGAGDCFFSGEEDLSAYPHAYDILNLSLDLSELPEGPVCPLTAVTPGNDQIYLSVYNRCFRSVSNAAFCDQAQLRRIYQEHQNAFLALEEDGTPWGMGLLAGSELSAIGVLPEFRGRGEILARSLLRRCPGPAVTLTVASDNAPAMGLYEKLGFRVTGLVSHWYRAE